MPGLDDVDRLAALHATGLTAAPADEAFDDLAALAARLLAAPVALVSLIDRDRQVIASQVGLAEPWASRREVPLTHSLCQHAVARGGPLVVPDARADATLADAALAALGVVAYVGVPVHAQGQPIGVVCAIDHAPRAWSDAQLALLQRLAAIAARELERRHLDLQLATATAALCDQHDLMTAVIDSMDESVVVVDPAGQLMLVNRAAEQTFGPAAVIDVMTRAPTEVPAVLGLLDVDGVTPRDPARTPMQRALAGEVVRGCELVVRAPATGAPRWRSVNAAPIRAADGRVRGAVAVGRDVTAIKEAQRALERSATRDALTGLYNRRGVHEHAQLALLRAERSGRPLALMFLDLDGLKVINDRLGHAAGDAALRRLAELLRATFRASDVVGRLGGDEFVVVAVDTGDDPDGVRLRARLDAALAAPGPTGAPPLAVSVGVVVHDPRLGARTLDELLADADARMYAAKRARRAARQGEASLTPRG